MSSAPFCTHGNLPYSTKWRGSTLGLVPLILYSRPVPHQQVHILPIKDTSPPSTFPTLQNGVAQPWACVSDFVQ